MFTWGFPILGNPHNMVYESTLKTLSFITLKNAFSAGYGRRLSMEIAVSQPCFLVILRPAPNLVIIASFPCTLLQTTYGCGKPTLKKGKMMMGKHTSKFPEFHSFFFGQNPIIVSVIKSIFNSYIWFSIAVNSLYPSSKTINHIFSIATSKLPELYS